MVQDNTKQWLVLTVFASAFGLLAAVMMGMVHHLTGWGFGSAAIPIGLGAGLAVLAGKKSGLGIRMLAAVIGTLPGIILFAVLTQGNNWQVRKNIATSQLDDLCVRIVALKLCYEHQVMGVFDFDDVPDSIISKAGDQVTELSEEEKYSICNRTFAQRINKSKSSIPVIGKYFWISLTLLIATGPVAIQYRRQQMQ